MEAKKKSYLELKCELKQANNTIKQLREANEFKRSEIELYKSHHKVLRFKSLWFLVVILSSALIWSLIL